MSRLQTEQLKSVCQLLGLERGGNKNALVNRIIDFLYNPDPAVTRVPSKVRFLHRMPSAFFLVDEIVMGFFNTVTTRFSGIECPQETKERPRGT